MYRSYLRCKTVKDGKVCNEEVGYRLVSHDSGNTLVVARKTCPKCKAVGENEDAMKWDQFPANSAYRGPTVHQMALMELERQRKAA